MPIIDQEKFDSWVKINQQDGYSNACVVVALEVMKRLDSDLTPLVKGYYPKKNTAHGLICVVDDEIGAGGLSGFQAGAVAQVVKKFHSRGEEFWNSYH